MNEVRSSNLVSRLRAKGEKGGIIPIGDMTILEAASEIERLELTVSDLREIVKEQREDNFADETPAPASKQQLIEAIIRDVCELPDYNSPDDQPNLLQCTVEELSAILESRLLEPPNDSNRCSGCGREWVADHDKCPTCLAPMRGSPVETAVAHSTVGTCTCLPSLDPRGCKAETCPVAIAMRNAVKAEVLHCRHGKYQEDCMHCADSTT